MDVRRLLAAISAAQLACGLAGLVVGLRRRYPYEFLWLRGRRATVPRDSILMGTALSAPVTMLVAQTAMTVTLTRRTSERSVRGLGVLGAAMVIGYVGERHVRHRLGPTGWDVEETPLVVAGIGLAAAMAALGLSRRSPGPAR